MQRELTVSPPIGAIRRGIYRARDWALYDAPTAIVGVFRDHRSARLIAAAALATFGALAVTAVVNEAALLEFDQGVQQRIIDGRGGWLDQAMVWLTFLGTRYAIGAATFGLVLWSAISGKARLFVGIVVATVLLNPVLEIVFKELVGRVRPNIDQLLPGNGPSFPSGHVLAATGFYGLLPFLTWETTRRPVVRLAALVASAFAVGVVAVSRPWLDVHWTSDAVAGVLLGAVAVIAAYQAYLSISRKQSRTAVGDGGRLVPASVTASKEAHGHR